MGVAVAGDVGAIAGALFAGETGDDFAGLAADRRAGESAGMEWSDAGGLQSHYGRGFCVRAGGTTGAAGKPDRDRDSRRRPGGVAHAGCEPRFFWQDLRSHGVGAGGFDAEFVSAAARGWV